MKLHRPLLAVLALVCASCASYDFRAQDVLLRHDAAADELELVGVSPGLVQTVDSSPARAAEAARGGRRVIVLGWPFEFDLDEIEEKLEGSSDPLAPRALAFVRGIQVGEAAAWRDADGGVTLYQRLVVPRAAEGLALLSEAINRWSVEDELHAAVAVDHGEATGALWEAFAREGRSWAELEDGALVVRVPMAPDGAARALQEMLEDAEACAIFVRPLSAVAVEDGLATLRWRPDADGWIRLHAANDPGRKALALPEDVELLAAPPRGVAALLEGPR